MMLKIYAEWHGQWYYNAFLFIVLKNIPYFTKHILCIDNEEICRRFTKALPITQFV